MQKEPVLNITNPLTSSDHPQSPSAAELLCLACGFCCDGTLHTNTVLLPTETEAVAALDMVVEHIGERPAFAQPCAMFRDGRCTIYSQRPQVCRHYECALLKRLLAGEIGLLQALRVVRIAQEQLAVWRGRVPTARSFMGWLRKSKQAHLRSARTPPRPKPCLRIRPSPNTRPRW